MSTQFGLITRHPRVLSSPPTLPNTLQSNTSTAASTRRKISELREGATRIELGALNARRGDFSYRSLYVLITGMTLATLSMVAIPIFLLSIGPPRSSSSSGATRMKSERALGNAGIIFFPAEIGLGESGRRALFLCSQTHECGAVTVSFGSNAEDPTMSAIGRLNP
jgi:hypothetical protein